MQISNKRVTVPVADMRARNTQAQLQPRRTVYDFGDIEAAVATAEANVNIDDSLARTARARTEGGPVSEAAAADRDVDPQWVSFADMPQLRMINDISSSSSPPPPTSSSAPADRDEDNDGPDNVFVDDDQAFNEGVRLSMACTTGSYPLGFKELKRRGDLLNKRVVENSGGGACFYLSVIEALADFDWSLFRKIFGETLDRRGVNNDRTMDEATRQVLNQEVLLINIP